MKIKNLAISLLAAVTISSVLASCNPVSTSTPTSTSSTGPIQGNFDFTVALASGKTTIAVGETDSIVVTPTITEDTITRSYTYKSSNTNRATISDAGVVTAGNETGKVTITIKETNSSKEQRLSITIEAKSTPASGGYNFAAAAGQEAIQKRTEILGKLEKYVVDSHLTGITLFENGGYVKYNSRLEIPADEYITGYGFGILSEGSIKTPMAEKNEENPDYRMYYHAASSSDPKTINAMNASGAQVSDLAGYITSSYWGTKMNETRNGYDWYPVLAADKVNGQDNNRPIPVYKKVNPLGLYKTWKIYVKTGEDGLKYRTNSTLRSSYDNRLVALEDYEFVYKLLLSGANKQLRGAEMAGDTTYGIKGAQAFYNNTKSFTDQSKVDALWDDMTTPDQDGNQKLGIKTGSDEGGKYIQLELINEIDEFTAMYTLSSSLVSPLPRDFIEEIGDGSVINGILKYGSFNNGGDNAILDYTLCLGAYTLEKWEKEQQTVFKQNDTWVERTTYPERYKIAGVKIRIVKAANEDTTALYKLFNNGDLDSCGVPTAYISQEIGNSDVRQTKGDATFKLNVNSCTQARWDELFGTNGKIAKGSTWDVKPWMSNDNFLKGLYWSIDRETFAKNRGVQPSINYFSDAYLSDPEKGVSYNSTEAHKNAVKDYHSIRPDTQADNYGYSKDNAVQYFKTAVSELLRSGDIKRGTKTNPSVIKIHIRWMYQTDITEYGNDIKQYFEEAFNDNAVSNGTIKLEVEQAAVTNWEDVYNVWMMKGQFDLAFGAISGNTYSPLNFLEVLKSDNSSGFTLNWGADTSKIDAKNPLVYNNEQWSFDALWQVSDHGGVVDNGEVVKSVKNCYLELPKALGTQTQTNKVYEGCTIDIPMEFVSVNDVEFEVNNVQLYIVGSGNKDLTYTYDAETKVIHVTISAEEGGEWNKLIKETNKFTDPTAQNYKEYPFDLSYYNVYWSMEVYYSIAIKKGTPSQTYQSVARSKEAQDAAQ